MVGGWAGDTGMSDTCSGGQALVIVRGLPGAGKTTIGKRIASELGATLAEADHFFEVDGAYRFDPARLPDAHAQCFRRAMATLASGGSVVVCNTGLSLWEVSPYVLLAAANGVAAEIITLRVESELAASRCTHGVPPNLYPGMVARMEAGNAEIERVYRAQCAAGQARLDRMQQA